MKASSCVEYWWGHKSTDHLRGALVDAPMGDET